MNSYFLAETVKYLFLLFDVPGSPRNGDSVINDSEMDITPVLPKDAVRFSAEERDLRKAYMNSLRPLPRRGLLQERRSRGANKFQGNREQQSEGTGIRGVKVEAAFGMPFGMNVFADETTTSVNDVDADVGVDAEEPIEDETEKYHGMWLTSGH